MLEELHVRDLALIDEAWLEFGPGLNVLTGETGAGKTVLLGALKLLLGERADPTLVRSGADEALVEGRFLLDGRERAARRRVSAEGRGRCYLDGDMSTVAGLAEALGPAVDLHGQHDHQALLSVATHAGFLDRAGGPALLELYAAYRERFAEHTAAVEEMDRLAEAMGERERRLDYARFVVAEIDAVGPKAKEDEELESKLPLLRHGEKLVEAASSAHRALREEGAGAADAAARAIAALNPVEGLDPGIDEAAGMVRDAGALLDEAASRIRGYGEGIDFDPSVLNDAEARLAALATLKKKYGPTLDDVLAERERVAAEAAALETGEEGLARARASVEESDRRLGAAAAALAEARTKAAAPFEERLSDACADLAMPSARFQVGLTELERADWTESGPQSVEFLFSGSAGEEPRPLARIASGGEVSRVMLALKGVLGAADTVPVLVFDEVDSGIGGATALAIGRRLASLSVGRQVVVVTHLAQVAAFADRQMVVSKEERDGRDVTTVSEVRGEERVAEVARMLAGSDTDTGLAHARELLASVAAKAV